VKPESLSGALDRTQAREFAGPWLEAWTGNRPDLLASFYSPDAFYRDPGVPEGLNGLKQITAYFTRLLAANPDWVWRHVDATPMEGGFLNHWSAIIPTAAGLIECRGVCTVRLERGLITRNEVFFDRTPLLPGSTPRE